MEPTGATSHIKTTETPSAAQVEENKVSTVFQQLLIELRKTTNPSKSLAILDRIGRLHR